MNISAYSSTGIPVLDNSNTTCQDDRGTPIPNLINNRNDTNDGMTVFRVIELMTFVYIYIYIYVCVCVCVCVCVYFAYNISQYHKLYPLFCHSGAAIPSASRHDIVETLI